MPYHRVTLAQLKERLTDRVGNNQVFWVEAEKRDAINEAICIWQALTGYWTSSHTFWPATTSNWQNVPTQVVSPQSVEYNSSELPLTSLYGLDYGSPGWEGTSGTPTEWSPAGLGKIILKPGPTVGGYVTVRGLKEAPTLENDGDYIDIGDEEVEKLLGYAHHVLAFKEANPEFGATKPEFDDFIKAAGHRCARFEKSALYKDYMGRAQDEDLRRQDIGTEIEVGAR